MHIFKNEKILESIDGRKSSFSKIRFKSETW